ncbi:MAG: glycine zipper family protein [Alphaproteobacteria bacterium]|nr:glycine zipper family protein [Alphaproteobacteria bacterium]
MSPFKVASLCGTALLLAACAYAPMGPTVRVLPPQGKPFEAFREDQFVCKNYASDQVRGQAESANETGLLQGLGGAILGAGLGAAIDGGSGAAIGAAGGATAGTAIAASTSSQRQKSIQEQYNDAYAQCMIAKGNLIEAPRATPTRTIIYERPAPPPPSNTTIIYNNPPPAPPPQEPPEYYAP